jgi:hypothetical protein
MKNIDKETAEELGIRIITLLNVTPIGRDTYRTSLGVRASEGIGRLINTIYNDIERKANKANKGT